MNNPTLYVLFRTEDGSIVGYYNNLEVLNSVKDSQTEPVQFCIMDKDFQGSILTKKVLIDVALIENEDTVIDSASYIVENGSDTQDAKAYLEYIKSNLIEEIRNIGNMYIASGMDMEISGEVMHFSFDMNRQLQLKELIDNYKEGDIVYYNASGEFDAEFTYSTIRMIYQTLFNNKVYNHIYTDVLCKWISENYTTDMHESKEIILTYGYSNDEIIEEVNKRYENAKLL